MKRGWEGERGENCVSRMVGPGIYIPKQNSSLPSVWSHCVLAPLTHQTFFFFFFGALLSEAYDSGHSFLWLPNKLGNRAGREECVINL